MLCILELQDRNNQTTQIKYDENSRNLNVESVFLYVTVFLTPVKSSKGRLFSFFLVP